MEESNKGKKCFFKNIYKICFKKGSLIRFVIIKSIILLILFGAFYSVKIAKHYPNKIDIQANPEFFGVTFSTKFSEELGLDWREVYLAILDDLQVKEIRLPIYWDEIETADGIFDFSDYDFIISEGEKRGVRFIANIGWRLPRWPECHAPKWVEKNNIYYTQGRAILMLGKVIDHYKGQESIVAWQLENEPFFDAFGVCPPSDDYFFQKELELLRSKDDRPILVSATGELSWWTKEAKYGDIFGSTLYRVVWGDNTGYVRYPIPAWFYRLKANLVGIEPENRYIIELQAEPWVPQGSMIYLPKEEAEKSFNMDQLKANLQVAINTRFKKTYIWGVEWWYFQYLNQDKSYWEFARTLF